MVRQPALEVISHLRRADYSKPALRYVFCILTLSEDMFATYLTMYGMFVVADLDWMCRWSEGKWKDHVPLPCCSLLCLPRMAGAAHTRW